MLWCEEESWACKWYVCGKSLMKHCCKCSVIWLPTNTYKGKLNGVFISHTRLYYWLSCKDLFSCCYHRWWAWIRCSYYIKLASERCLILLGSRNLQQYSFSSRIDVKSTVQLYIKLFFLVTRKIFRSFSFLMDRTRSSIFNSFIIDLCGMDKKV